MVEMNRWIIISMMVLCECYCCYRGW